MATPSEAFLARDEESGNLVICEPSSNPLPEDRSQHPPPVSSVKEMFRNSQPSHLDRLASFVGLDLTQQHAYELLERMLKLRSSIRAILPRIEKHKDTPTPHTNPCIDMLDAEKFETDAELRIIAHDVICARHSAVLDELLYILNTEDEDGQDMFPLWLEAWQSKFASVSMDFSEEHLVPLSDAFGEALHSAYRAHSHDVERVAHLLTLGLGTEELW
jgi:hypothetical protein